MLDYSLVWRPLWMLVALSACAACSQTTQTTTNEVVSYDDPAIGPSGAGSEPQWQSVTDKDPISGKSSITASRTFSSSPFYVDLKITCGGSHDLNYVFTTYDEQRQPAGFVSQGRYNVTLIEYRADDASDSQASEPQRYPNQANLWAFFPKEPTLPFAKHVTFRLALLNGQPVISFDQTDPVVRPVIEACTQTQAPSPTASAVEGAAEDQQSDTPENVEGQTATNDNVPQTSTDQEGGQ